MSYLSDKDRKRLWDKIDIKGEDECWNWTAAKSIKGYGMFYSCGMNLRSHRVVILDSIGMKDRNNVIRHMCDNPSCCNPAHLLEGTVADNNHDIMRHGNYSYCRGKLNEKFVSIIKRTLTKDKSKPMRLELARIFNVSPNTIWNIGANKIWIHVKI